MRFSSRARVCSSIIGAILIALPSTWGVKRKSLTRTPVRGIGLHRQDRGDPGPLARGDDLDLQAFLAPPPVDLLIDLTALVVARRPDTAEPVAGCLVA
ncbi:hypothetical protein I546_4043 [Mycobacterium kansasii 732]|nr:hypothetical protein I546_4043 [Mycobacterium kansasii 732]